MYLTKCMQCGPISPHRSFTPSVFILEEDSHCHCSTSVSASFILGGFEQALTEAETASVHSHRHKQAEAGGQRWSCQNRKPVFSTDDI